LLHDIGKMVLGEYVREDLKSIEEMVAKGISFEVAEYVVLGTNHADVGARILAGWSMPKELVQAVAWHHDPDHCDNRCMLSDLVHVANIAVRGTGNGKMGNDPSSEAVLNRLGLIQDDIAALAEQALEEMKKLADILNEV
jgi:putative nucleotidyltransferase with HDIG domain